MDQAHRTKRDNRTTSISTIFGMWKLLRVWPSRCQVLAVLPKHIHVTDCFGPRQLCPRSDACRSWVPRHMWCCPSAKVTVLARSLECACAVRLRHSVLQAQQSSPGGTANYSLMHQFSLPQRVARRPHGVSGRPHLRHAFFWRE